jgi:hypothetical protein
MPITQGAYLETSFDLREGEIAMAGVTTDQLSAVNAQGAVLPFGRGVIFAAGTTGSHERTLLMLPTTAGQTIRGVSVATDIIERTVDANGNPGYPAAGSPQVTVMSYCTKGIIAVRTVEAVVKGQAVSTLITPGATQGLFGTTVDATRIACPTNWEWYSSAASGAIALLYLK